MQDLSADALKAARNNVRENREKARAAYAAQEKRTLQAERARLEKQNAQQSGHRALSQMLSAAARSAPAPPAAAHVHPVTRKRHLTTASPHTMSQATRQRALVYTSCRPVWSPSHPLRAIFDDGRCSLTEQATREGEKATKEPAAHLVADAMQDGLVLERGPDSFGTCDLGGGWHRSAPWGAFAAQLLCVVEGQKNQRVRIKSDGGLGVVKIGGGGSNVVVRPPPHEVPSWLPSKKVVYRVTRTDGCSYDNKYTTLSNAVGEAENAIFAALNGIGVGVHAIAAYHGIRAARTLRYGAVYVLEEAKCDLSGTLAGCHGPVEARRVAVLVYELLYDAARKGVMFVDIKPANILQMPDGSFKLTDTDPTFFIRLQREDWRTLLLVNLALLAAHVHNANFATGDAFIGTFAPELRQLVCRHREYRSAWLFEARSVNITFEAPTDKSEFQMQRLFVMIAHSYFYSRDVSQTLKSARFQWERQHTSELHRFWASASNRDRWPPVMKTSARMGRGVWGASFKPLITQLVEFALGA